MNILLVAGLTRPAKGVDYVANTLFDRQSARQTGQIIAPNIIPSFDIANLIYTDRTSLRPLLRPRRDSIPNLTTAVLEDILRTTGQDFVTLPLSAIWDESTLIDIHDIDVALVSTTFISNEHLLEFVLQRVRQIANPRYVVLGGQYSNLKYRQIMARYPEVSYIITGDGEEALPKLLTAIELGYGFEDIFNLALRDTSGAVRHTGIHYIDLELQPSPSFQGHHAIIPYESMRGCPFSCRYCSYPAASPKWRYKSAKKIANDWRKYRDENGAHHIKAMDSTFTVPPKRLKEVLNLLQPIAREGLTWEAYARANVVRDPIFVQQLLDAGCVELSIGFESMSETVLGYMNKRVHADENRKAAELITNSDLRLRVCIMVGYPGETPEDYQETHDYLVHDFKARCMLSPFSFIDETMPVWGDFEKFNVKVTETPQGQIWQHVGMSLHEAKSLIAKTLDDLRWKNEDGVMLLWQFDYETPFVPHLSDRINQRIEKLVERLAFLTKDFPQNEEREHRFCQIIDELSRYGITYHPADFQEDPLASVDSIWIDFI